MGDAMSLNSNDMSFLPDGYLEDKSQRRANVLWGGIFAIVAVGIGVAHYYAERNVRAEETLNKAVQAQFESSKKSLEKLQDLQKVQQELNQKVRLSGSLVEKVLRTEILAELTNQLPNAVMLTDVQLESKKIEAPVQNLSALERAMLAHEREKNALPEPILYDVAVRLRGIASGDQLVAQYMANLAASPLFGQLRLPITRELAENEGKKTSTLRVFELEMMLKRSADTRLQKAPTTLPASQPVAVVQ